MERKMWDIKELGEENALELYIYDDVEGDSYDWWSGEVIESETSANHFRNELAKYPDVSEIKVYLNSYGGSVFEGTAIYNQLKRHKAKKTVYVDGFACSIASVIAMAGDEVIMPANSLMMIHNPWMYVAGNADDLRKAADDLEVIAKASRQAYLSKAGDKLSEAELAQMMEAETWLSAEDCIRLGLADKLSEKAADMSNAQAMMKKANLSLEAGLKIRQSLQEQIKALTVDTKDVKDNMPKEPTLFETLGGFFDRKNN